MKKEKNINDNIIAVEPHISCRFITHLSESTWGASVYIIEETGKAFARIYRYEDDNDNIYMEGLSVNLIDRRMGIASNLLTLVETECRKLSAKTLHLWCHKNDWVHDWYKRIGFVDGAIYEDEEGAIWMSKSLLSDCKHDLKGQTVEMIEVNLSNGS